MQNNNNKNTIEQSKLLSQFDRTYIIPNEKKP